MNKRIPVRLKREPLLEAVWELRFSGNKPSVADLMPGMLFNALPGKHAADVVRLPTADIPIQVIEHDRNLRYMPKIRLEEGNQAIQIGERVVSFSCRRPYSGWKKFSADIRNLAKTVRDTGLIKTLERFSLKYIDLIELDRPLGLGCLNLNLYLGGHEIDTKPVQFRTEIKERDLTHIVQIVSPAEAVAPGYEKRLKGVLVDIDTIKTLDENESWDDLERRLDEVHLACKIMFFNLMAPETIFELGPEYEG